MQDFIYNIPTRVYFGRNQLKHLPGLIHEYGTKVLIVYGGGSIRRSGLYDKITSLLSENSIPYEELGGVEPNPRVSTVRRGIQICRDNDIDLILPVGGGSTIDCAKAISAGLKYDGDVWELCLDRTKIRDAIPIIAIPTMAATGSEMDPFGVISNEKTNDKKGLGSTLLTPKAAICEPELTFSVSAFQTASGTADIVSHVLETYFRNTEDSYFAKRMSEGILKTCFHYGPAAVCYPDDYTARSNLMWASEWAINGFIKCGLTGPWAVHPIEHQLSAYYDIAHGAGLAILTPHWFYKIMNFEEGMVLLAEYGKNVWDIPEKSDIRAAALEAISKTEHFFFEELKLPSTLRKLGVSNRDNFEIMAEKSIRDGAGNAYFPLTKNDIIDIYNASF